MWEPVVWLRNLRQRRSHMIIANGKDVRILQDIFQDDYVGTLFTANENPNFNVATYVMETIG